MMCQLEPKCRFVGFTAFAKLPPETEKELLVNISQTRPFEHQAYSRALTKGAFKPEALGPILHHGLQWGGGWWW